MHYFGVPGTTYKNIQNGVAGMSELAADRCTKVCGITQTCFV